MLVTVITGTILATGKTLTHGLGTTPDFISVTLESDTSGTNVRECSILTFGANTVTVAGPVDGAAVRIKCENFAGATHVVKV
jgi:hypothetical protein